MGKTLTSTGNFYARPNASPDIGFTIEYHFHEFSHTVIPMAGLWRVRQYTYVEGDVSPNEANFLSEILIGPDNYHPPETQVERWALIEKNRWHSLTLISKTVYLSHAQMVLVPEQQVTVPAGTQFVMEDGGPWNTTTYGTQFLFYARMVGASPVQITGPMTMPPGMTAFWPIV